MPPANIPMPRSIPPKPPEVFLFVEVWGFAGDCAGFVVEFFCVEFFGADGLGDDGLEVDGRVYRCGLNSSNQYECGKYRTQKSTKFFQGH